ncbi:uncharacterized protein LOC114441993 isoform X2 [Parambassis ranga]|uniref:Uncharacterized protein LOC114441993 isoform X2 n=1 Tax=Parambassis ranga TaxID=210632 RepID=A0A6P7J3E6_9TELE|nr:uncharacterized protein LOC114441993 isoform X2 [Parambassis ranga]
MDNSAANKTHITCQSWVGQNGWSTTSSQGPINALSTPQHLNLGSSSDQRPLYDHLQASSQGCMSDLSTLSSRNSLHHLALQKDPHISNISLSSTMFSNPAIPNASHIISSAQQSSQTPMLITANQGKHLPPPPSLSQPIQGLQLCRPQHLPLLSCHDPYKASFQTPLPSHSLPNRLHDLPVSLPSCRQNVSTPQVTFEGENVEAAAVTGYAHSCASSTSQEQLQWIPPLQCRGAVSDSVPDVHSSKESLPEGNIPPTDSNERRRAVLLHQRAQLLKQLAEMDKLLESLPPDDSGDRPPPHTALQPSPSTDESSQCEKTKTGHAGQVQLSTGKSHHLADSSSSLFYDEQNGAPDSPLSAEESAEKADTSGESGDDRDPDYLPDTSGFKSEASSCFSDECSHNSPSTPTDRRSPVPLRKRAKSESSSCEEESASPPKKQCAASQKKPPETVVLPMSNSNKQRIYDKRNYCLFCAKPMIKLARHLERIHSDKPEVAAAFQYPKHSRERRKVWKKLTNQGNFAHNKTVLRTGKGQLAVRKRPNQPGKALDFLHCLHCQGLYCKKALYRHMKKCSEKDNNDPELQIGRKRIASRCALEAVGDNISECVRNILSDMIFDDVTQVIMDDKILLQFGEQMFDHYGRDEKKYHYIRQNLRQIARLVLEAQKTTPMQKLEDFFHSSNFQHVVSAVNVLAGYDPEKKTYSAPSLALKLGYHLQKTCGIVESNAVKRGDDKQAESARHFLTVYQKKWNKLISSDALSALKETKLDTEKKVPFAQDVKRLHFHLESVHLRDEKKLRDDPSAETYAALARAVLCRIIIFNRRRPREVSLIQLKAFMSRKKSDVLDDFDVSVSDMERTLCGFFIRLDIPGNCGRKVPVLLKPEFVSAMELLVSVREACGIPGKNPYLFARPSTLSAYNGSECLQKYIRECGAKNPEALTSKKIRKHFTTMLQLMNLDDNEADQILGPNNQVQVLRENSDMTLDDIELESGARFQPASEQQAAFWDHNGLSGVNCGQGGFSHHQALGVTACTNMTTPTKSVKSNGQAAHYKPKHKWEEEEVCAVERHMMRFIQGHKVPQKNDCVQCLEAEPKALQNRSWKGVKDYVRNRITTLKRQSGCLSRNQNGSMREEPRQSTGHFQQL